MKDAAPRATTIGMRASAMAQRIQRRHARDELAARHPEMLLARIPVATLQVAYSASHIHWAPRIALTFASAGGSPRVVSPARGHGAAAESRRLRVDHVVQRLTARAIRVHSVAVAAPARDLESGAAAGAAPAMRIDPGPDAGAPAVPRILRKTQLEMPDPAAAHETPPPTFGITGRAAWSGWPEPTSTRPSAAVDLESLTDRVVSALNRRVTAHRERLGR